MKYSEWLTQWLENYIKPSSKEKTYNRYVDIVNQHIVTHLGDKELDELTAIELQQFVTMLLNSGNLKTGQGLAPNSVNSIINVLQGSLRCANYLGISEEYSADKIKRPKQTEKKITCFTNIEQKKIEAAVLQGKRDKMFGIVLCLYTGLRIGELMALEWSDIDLGNGKMTVSKSCYDGKNKNGHWDRIINEPKTETSKREIPIPKQLIPKIKEIKNVVRVLM